MEETFLGHNTKYWIELEKEARKLGVTDYIQEIADLRGKLSFIESRLKDISKVLGRNY